MSLWHALLESCQFASLEMDYSEEWLYPPAGQLFDQNYRKLLQCFQSVRYFRFIFKDDWDDWYNHRQILRIWTSVYEALNQLTHFQFTFSTEAGLDNFFDWLDLLVTLPSLRNLSIDLDLVYAPIQEVFFLARKQWLNHADWLQLEQPIDLPDSFLYRDAQRLNSALAKIRATGLNVFLHYHIETKTYTECFTWRGGNGIDPSFSDYLKQTGYKSTGNNQYNTFGKSMGGFYVAK